MTRTRYASVWDAIEATPQAAASLKARSTLMIELTGLIEARSMTQEEAAVLFGVTQPRVSDLVRGKIHLFSLDTLVDMAAAAGFSPVVTLGPRRLLAKRRAPLRGRRLLPAG